MADYQTLELCTGRPLQFNLTRADEPLDLSEADAIFLTLRRESDGDLLIDHAEMDTVGELTAGVVSYTFDELPAGSAGLYQAQIIVTWSDRGPEDAAWNGLVRVGEHFGSYPPPSA